jgi:DNA helicase-2/ATP-dependent DNA helicase PcrA
MTAFGSSYGTPGWQRAQANKGRGGFDETGNPYGKTGRQGGPGARYVREAEDDDARAISDEDIVSGGATSSPPPPAGEGQDGGRRAPQRRRTPLTIEGELVAKSTGTVSAFSVGDRVFHLKFGNGNVVAIDGNKLTIAFDKAGEKRVVDSFVERV